MSFSIEPEALFHKQVVEDLTEASFGPERHKRTVQKFRKGVDALPNLSFVARDQGNFIGSIRFWPVSLPNDQMVPLLGPLAVLGHLRGKGVGRALITHGITAAKIQNHKAILIIGDPGYYAQFGFQVDLVKNLTLPGPVTPLTFMGLEIEKQSLSNLNGPVTAHSDYNHLG
jgi:predicted N-acetyltransferase YhbS